MQSVSQKGQMVIPADFRGLFNIQAGTLVLIVPDVDRQEIVIKPTKAKNTVSAGFGLLSGGESLTKALLEEKVREQKAEAKKYERIMGA